MVEHVFTELMNLGIVGFCLFVFEITVNITTKLLYHFEIAHLMLFGFGLFYAGSAAVILVRTDNPFFIGGTRKFRFIFPYLRVISSHNCASPFHV